MFFNNNNNDNKDNGTLEHKHEMEIERLKHQHSLEIQQKEFDLKHYKDEKLSEVQGELSKAKQQIAVLEKENNMLDKIVDLNGDIIDVKDLVRSLVEKLPTIDLKSLTVNNGAD